MVANRRALPTKRATKRRRARSLINRTTRIRYDVVDTRGHVTLRYMGQLRHLNVGWSYIGQSIRLYVVVDDHVAIVTEDGELVSEITINPDRDYQPIKRTVPL